MPEPAENYMLAGAIAPFSTIHDFVPDVDGVTLHFFDFIHSRRGVV
jgi:hypothetical protein